MGDPIGHTKGYADYAEALAAAGLDAAYLPAHVPAGRFRDFLGGLRHLRNLAGVVATIPHKHDAYAAATPDAVARRAGSANLLRPTADGWEATMLDGTGFRAAADAGGIALAGRRVQQLGAGGAGRAVAMAIAEAGPARLSVSDPDAARAEALVADIRREFPTVGVVAALGPADTLVNCSPVGMGTDARLPVPEDLVPEGGFVYDIVNRPDTPLVEVARRRGCVADHGRSMMLAQVQLLIRFLFER
ncbi:shikimate dehydrogenase family protein [Falsiroseomonas sp. CW058]|uniref:shikimate dehydrogenase family protein n=1 Tax=Falsiroseomonas sp. CW058 TaxID=3388664 RepID=UPI003D3196C9